MQKRSIIAILILIVLTVTMTALIGCDQNKNSGEYTITFDTDGGTKVKPINKDKYGTIDQEPLSTKDGYTFAGWYDGKMKITFPYTVKTSKTFIAKWISNGITPTEIFRYKLSEDESSYIITSIKTELYTELTIPSIYNDKPITQIGDYAFSNSSITKVIIPASITIIGEGTFYRCNKLTNISISDSVTSIGDYAFYECISLTELLLPKNLATIGKYAFAYSVKLNVINIPNGVATITDSAFAKCSALTSVVIPNSVNIIEENAFADCVSLISVNIPNSVEGIGKSAFATCSNLPKIFIPNSVVSMQTDVFYQCIKITILCQASVKPLGWSDSWNGNRPVRWGQKL